MKYFLFITATSLFLCALPLFGMLYPLEGIGGGGLFAQSTVRVQNLGVDYLKGQVRVRVSWTDQSQPRHRNKVWVFVDYQPVNNASVQGPWTAATLSAPPIVTAGTVSQQNTRGFYLEGSKTNFSSDITLTLSQAPAKFSWCVYVSDYPPNATLNADASYSLHGTLPFVVNNQLQGNSATFSGYQFITALTDATGCPGIWDPPCLPGWIGPKSANCPPACSAGSIKD